MIGSFPVFFLEAFCDTNFVFVFFNKLFVDLVVLTKYLVNSWVSLFVQEFRRYSTLKTDTSLINRNKSIVNCKFNLLTAYNFSSIVFSN